MRVAPTRSFPLLAISIVVGAVIVSASALSYSSFESTVTKTITSVQVRTSTYTTTSTLVRTNTTGTTCGPGGGMGDLDDQLTPYNSTTDCNLGITLSLLAGASVGEGQNETVGVSLTSDLPIARAVNYTGLPPLPRGLEPSSGAAFDFILPLQPPCGYPSMSSYEPAFIVVYNESGSPIQLSDSPVPVLNCISTTGGTYHSFNASQTVTESVSLGGYWSSPDKDQPWVDAIYSPFSSGNYTILAFDPWEQTVEMSFSVTAPAGAPSISTAAVSNTTISGFPMEMALDSNNSRLYVADGFANEISVIDATSGALIGTITLPGTPSTGIAVDSQRNLIFVPVQGCTNLQNASNSCLSAGSSSLEGGIVEIAGSNDAIVKELPLQVALLAVNQASGVLYGADAGSAIGSNSSGYILAVNERSGEVTANISLGAYPLSVSIDAKNNTLYVGACQQIELACGGAEVLIVNGSTDRVQDKIALPFDALNFPIVVNPDSGVIYAMGLAGQNLTLVAIDGASGRVEYSMKLGGSCQGAGGGELALNIKSNQLYVAFDSQDLFLAVDAANGQIVNMLSTQGIYDVAYNAGTNQVYVLTELQNTSEGHLLTLPSSTGGNYVNYSLLSGHACFP